jgi:transposase-like protein
MKGLLAGKPLNGPDGILTPMIKQALEAILEGEMEAHLASEPIEGARRNGKAKKTVKTGSGAFELETPRDRHGTFEPQIVKKRQTVLTNELDEKILALYSLGTGYRDIAAHIKDMYGIEISTATISAITDKLLPAITEWRNRPLEDIYPVVFLDAIFFKQREAGQVVTKASYSVIGINQEGYKDVLGIYTAEQEGASFWLGVITELQARGVKDILIACVDGLKGFPEAINTIFPKTEIQLCVVHQIRNSLKYVISKDQKLFMSDLKTVYKADTKALAEDALLSLDEKWGKKYPTVLRSWNNNWENLSHYFKYAPSIRKLIYTTNPVEGFHRQVRKYTKTKGAFSSENALIKLIYCATMNIKKKWNMPLANWGLSICQLDIHFSGRLNLTIK